MAHQVGGVELPAGSQANAPAPGAPWLAKLTHGIRTAIERHCNEAWLSIAPSERGVVASDFPRPPGECQLNKNDWPALFVWSQREGPSERVAQEIVVQNVEIRVMWIPPPGIVANVQRRHPFWTLLGGVLALYTTDSIASPFASEGDWGEQLVDYACMWSLLYRGGDVTQATIEAGGSSEQTLAYEWILAGQLQNVMDPTADVSPGPACTHLTIKGGSDVDIALFQSHLEP